MNKNSFTLLFTKNSRWWVIITVVYQYKKKKINAPLEIGNNKSPSQHVYYFLCVYILIYILPFNNITVETEKKIKIDQNHVLLHIPHLYSTKKKCVFFFLFLINNTSLILHVRIRRWCRIPHPTRYQIVCLTGICKTCGGVDTIFGTWSIVHPAKDCHDLQMSIETKRDIFRKEMLYVKKIQKLERLKSTNNNAGEVNPQQQSEATSGM